MKKLCTFLSALSLILILFVPAKANIRRVGFFGPAVANVDYTTFTAAYTAALSNDTILMMPGSDFGGVSVAKRLIIIGPGYFLDPSNTTTPGNPGLQANPNTTSGGLYFYPGSDSSQVLGCTLGYCYFYGGNGILIKRCNCNGTYFYVNSNAITFQQCYLPGYFAAVSTTVSTTNISFLNCVFDYALGFTNNTSSGLISNCIFTNAYGHSFGSGGWLIQNSIANGASFAGTNLIFSNDIGTGTQFPVGNGNQQNKPWNTIFTLTGSMDGKYILLGGSPAIGAGTNGIDCGIFGGAAPYRLSGIPPIPTIYALSSPQGTTPPGNTIQINLSTRSNN